MKSVLVILFSIVTLSTCLFPNVYQENHIKHKWSDDVGEPLILTPLIKENKLEEARNVSRVTSEIFQNVESYSGFLTVNEEFGGNMFFWFFPSESNYSIDPLVVWLQGGPGATSMFGLFEENGPFKVSDDLEVQLREYTWTKTHSVLYIDNPVGTGFSFTSGGYCEDQTCVGENLYEFVQQFFTMFPELQTNEFYVAGESYAGKYVPALGYTIHKKNEAADLKINLKGLFIGNGLSDPVNQFFYSDYVYQLGLVDLNTRNRMNEFEKVASNLAEKGDYITAYSIIVEVFNGPDSIFSNAAGPVNVYNYVDGTESTAIYQFFERDDVRTAIHVGNSNFDTNFEVFNSLMGDIMKSVAPWISELLNHYRVLVHSGQLDLIVGYPLTLKYLDKLNFSAAEEYANATREQWFVGKELAGYKKTAGNLTEVLVRNAGHSVPYDQPKWAYDLFSKFTANIP